MNSGTNSVETAKAISNLLKTDKDILACLTNCSNNGLCLLNKTNEKYSCRCFNNFNGISCQLDARACSKYPCLNNGTCLNTNLNDFECQCNLNYFGLNCENKIELCQNQTCSGQGYCFENNSQSYCKCFIGYNGDKCEVENVSVKILRGVKLVSILICAFTIGFTIFLLVSNDVWNFFEKTCPLRS